MSANNNERLLAGNIVKEWRNRYADNGSLGTLTPTTDTGSANGIGGGTPVTPTPTTNSPVMTYGEYEGLINTAKAQRGNAYKMWDDYAKNEIARANAAHSASYAEADRLRAQAERDAWLSFEKSAPTYGAQGESLARSGLAGSGYGAYLEGRNYATARNEVSAAGATAAKSKAAADMTYADAEADINGKVIEGKAAADTAYNEFENSIQAQIIADEKAEEENKNTAYLQISELIANGTFTTPDQVKAAAAQAGLDGDTIKSLLGGMLGDFSTFKTSIENGMLDMSALNAAKGLSISEDEYNNLLGMYRNAFDTSKDSFKDESGNLVSYTEAKDILDKALANDALTPEMKKELEGSFRGAYSAFGTTIEVDWKADDDARLKYGGDTYKIGLSEVKEGDGAVADVSAVAERFEIGTIFVYHGALYLKDTDKTIYEIRARNNTDARRKDFDNLSNLFFKG